jgi:phage baseplate assembly protein W
MSWLSAPYRIGTDGRTETADLADHVRDLIEAVVFTAPGERVNRRDFGSGIRQLLFAPASPELVAANQYLLQGSLQQHLAHLVEVGEVRLEVEGPEVRVTVAYRIRRNGQDQVATVVRSF